MKSFQFWDSCCWNQLCPDVFISACDVYQPHISSDSDSAQMCLGVRAHVHRWWDLSPLLFTKFKSSLICRHLTRLINVHHFWRSCTFIIAEVITKGHFSRLLSLANTARCINNHLNGASVIKIHPQMTCLYSLWIIKSVCLFIKGNQHLKQRNPLKSFS